MKVFVTTAISKDVGTYLPLFHFLATQDRFRVHTLIEDPEAADVILFLDGHQHYADLELNAIYKHPLVQRFRHKSLVYSELDQPWCAMPGLYVSMPGPFFDWRRQRPCSYLSRLNTLVEQNGNITGTPSLLFSYMGRRCHPVRDRILKLKHHRAYIEDTTGLDFFGDSNDELLKRKHHYASVVRDSKFILCPRGGGLASFRLFETLAAGRVPVIISDGWVPPVGPIWDQVAVRVRESQTEQVASIIESRENEFETMARNARSAWEQWFAPDVLFHRMIENCGDILTTRSDSRLFKPRLLNVRYLYLLARSIKWKIRKRILNAVKSLRLGAIPSVSHSGKSQSPLS